MQVQGGSGIGAKNTGVLQSAAERYHGPRSRDCMDVKGTEERSDKMASYTKMPEHRNDQRKYGAIRTQ